MQPNLSLQAHKPSQTLVYGYKCRLILVYRHTNPGYTYFIRQKLSVILVYRHTNPT